MICTQRGVAVDGSDALHTAGQSQALLPVLLGEKDPQLVIAHTLPSLTTRNQLSLSKSGK
jgi:hypothetical protein